MEEVDIDLNDPEVQKAATKIQASFRGHKIRKDIETKKDSPQDKTAATTEEEEEIAAIDLTDPDLANAALKIQAGFRGHIARKQVKTVDDVTKDMAAHSIKEPEEDIDIDLTDPEVNKAAIKIQSTFRGHMTRKTNQ